MGTTKVQLAPAERDRVNEMLSEGYEALDKDGVQEELLRASAAYKTPGCQVNITSPNARVGLATYHLMLKLFDAFIDRERTVATDDVLEWPAVAQIEFKNGSCIVFYIGDHQ